LQIFKLNLDIKKRVACCIAAYNRMENELPNYKAEAIGEKRSDFSTAPYRGACNKGEDHDEAPLEHQGLEATADQQHIYIE
jgi:hypothetical protein